MKLFELLNEADLTSGMEEGLINARPSGDGQTIYNYSDRAMFTPGAWDNPAVRICRGLIVDDATQNVVARGWAKFYNSNQPEADVIDMDEPVEVTDKMDGSLGIIHLTSAGELRVATRGSFESDQAKWATDWLRSNTWVMDDINWPITPLVEIIYPENRIVCEYDFEGLVLLGGVNYQTGQYLGPQTVADVIGWSGQMTEVFEYATLKEALAAPPRPGKEGLVVRAGERIVKLKQEDYLKAHAYLTNCTPRKIWSKMGEGYGLEDFLVEAPDEFIPLVTQYYHEVKEAYNATSDEVWQEWWDVREKLPFDYSRKDLAQEVQSSTHKSALFMLADGKDIFPYIMKRIRPDGV